MKHLTSVSCTVTLQLMLGPIYMATHQQGDVFSEQKSLPFLLCLHGNNPGYPRWCLVSVVKMESHKPDEVPDSKGEGMDGEDDLTSIPTGIATLISNTIVSGTFCFIRLHVYNMATFQHAQLLGHRLQNLPLVKLFGVFSCKQKDQMLSQSYGFSKMSNRALVSWGSG